MGIGRNTIVPNWDAARFGNGGCNLLSRKDTALARFGALREFDFDATDRINCIDAASKNVERESAILIACTEVAGTELPHQIGSELMVAADTTFSGIVKTTGLFGALVQGRDRPFSEGTIGHCGYVDDGVRSIRATTLMPFPHRLQTGNVS